MTAPRPSAHVVRPLLTTLASAAIQLHLAPRDPARAQAAADATAAYAAAVGEPAAEIAERFMEAARRTAESSRFTGDHVDVAVVAFFGQGFRRSYKASGGVQVRIRSFSRRPGSEARGIRLQAGRAWTSSVRQCLTRFGVVVAVGPILGTSVSEAALKASR